MTSHAARAKVDRPGSKERDLRVSRSRAKGEGDGNGEAERTGREGVRLESLRCGAAAAALPSAWV